MVFRFTFNTVHNLFYKLGRVVLIEKLIFVYRQRNDFGHLAALLSVYLPVHAWLEFKYVGVPPKFSKNDLEHL